MRFEVGQAYESKDGQHQAVVIEIRSEGREGLLRNYGGRAEWFLWAELHQAGQWRSRVPMTRAIWHVFVHNKAENLWFPIAGNLPENAARCWFDHYARRFPNLPLRLYYAGDIVAYRNVDIKDHEDQVQFERDFAEIIADQGS
jgi:hypothetical protein